MGADSLTVHLQWSQTVVYGPDHSLEFPQIAGIFFDLAQYKRECCVVTHLVPQPSGDQLE